jgi:hypothetical protein
LLSLWRCQKGWTALARVDLLVTVTKYSGFWLPLFWGVDTNGPRTYSGTSIFRIRSENDLARRPLRSIEMQTTINTYVLISTSQTDDYCLKTVLVFPNCFIQVLWGFEGKKECIHWSVQSATKKHLGSRKLGTKREQNNLTKIFYRKS